MNLATKPEPTKKSLRNPTPSRDINKVKKLPRQTLPKSIEFLLMLHYGSKIFAIALIAMTLGFYAKTVYAPTQWSKEYKKLTTLQGQERELTTTNETMKDLLAEQAEKPGTGLVKPLPSNVLFLSPSNQPVLEVKEANNLETSNIPVKSFPQGY